MAKKVVKPKQFKIEGYGYEEKIVGESNQSSGRIYLPADWINKRVAVVKLDE